MQKKEILKKKNHKLAKKKVKAEKHRKKYFNKNFKNKISEIIFGITTKIMVLELTQLLDKPPD